MQAAVQRMLEAPMYLLDMEEQACQKGSTAQLLSEVLEGFLK